MLKPLSLSFAALLVAVGLVEATAQAEGGVSKVVNYDLSGKSAATVAADYDGDGVVDQATVQAGGSGKALTWNISLSSGGSASRTVGNSGDKVIAGCDVDGDGKADMIAASGSELRYTSSKTGKLQVYATQGPASDYSCWDTDGSGQDAVVATMGRGQAVYQLAKALPCSSIRELGAPYLWKSSTSSHVPKSDVRQTYKGSFIGKRRASRIPFKTQVAMYDTAGNVVGYTCKYAQLGTYQFRYYNGSCPSKLRATTQTQQARAVANTGSKAVALYVQSRECLRLSRGPTISRQGNVR